MSKVMPSVDFEYVKCNLCGENKSELLFKAKDRFAGEDSLRSPPDEFNIVRCCNCGLVYLNPRPTTESIPSYYPKEYGVKISKLTSVKFRLSHIYRRLFGGDLYSLGSLPEGRVLDIGCGSGFFLRRLADEEWETHGVDSSPVAIGRATSLGVNAFLGKLEEAHFEDEYFDAAVMIHSLEHMHDPLATLIEVHRVMKDQGILIIGVPNIGSISAKVFKQFWDGIDTPRHLYCFSPHTLKLILEKAGFRMINISYEPLSPLMSLSRFTKNKWLQVLLRSKLLLALFYPPGAIISKIFHQGSIMVVKARKELRVMKA